MWKVPPRVKIFEALGALSDLRISRMDCSTTPAALQLTSFSDFLSPLTPLSSGADPLTFQCRSSEGNKTYTLKMKYTSFEYSVSSSTVSEFIQRDGVAMSSTDAGSLYQGYLGYPLVALLIHFRYLDNAAASNHDVVECVAMLKGVPWKRLAVEQHNDWDLVIGSVLMMLGSSGVSREKIEWLNGVVDALHEALRKVVEGCVCCKYSKGTAKKRGREIATVAARPSV